MKARLAGAAAFLAGASLLAVPASASVSQAARTCQAYAAWQQHPTQKNLDAVMTDSFSVPWKYLGEDADGLYGDVRAGKTARVAKDKKYFAMDCPS